MASLSRRRRSGLRPWDGRHYYIGHGPNAQKMCSLCASLNSMTSMDYQIDHGAQEHQSSFGALRTSAQQGCQLCRLFYHATINCTRENANEAEAWHFTLDKTSDRLPFFFDWIWQEGNEERYIWNAGAYMYSRKGHGSRAAFLHLSPAVGLVPRRGQDPSSPDEADFPSQLVSSFTDPLLFKRWCDRCFRCGEPHKVCPVLTNKPLPTRLISVGTCNSHYVRIIESGGLTGKYATLSHRWGNPAEIYCTMKQNFAQHLQSISFSELPKTFQNAIMVTRYLGLEYLWIDALCIIQDIEADWQHECSTMHLVYANSALTIFAAAADGPNCGFLTPTRQAPPPCIIPYRSATSPYDTEQQSVVLSYLGHVRRPFDSPPATSLDKRAWILQERLLSTRVLVFDTVETYFDCRAGRQRGAFPNDITSSSDMFSAGTLTNETLERPLHQYESHVQLWLHIVSDYTQRDLTKQSDIFPGLSGIAQKLKARSESEGSSLGEYLAGAWSSETALFCCLLWYPYGRPSRYQVASTSIAPSWSWASCSRPVSFLGWGHNASVAKYQSHNVIPQGVDHYGEVRSGAFIQIMAYTRSFTFDELKPDPVNSSELMIQAMNFESPPEPSHDSINYQFCWPAQIPNFKIRISLDNTDNSFSPQHSFTCAIVYSWYKDFAWSTEWHGLMLSPSSEGRFRRVGVIRGKEGGENMSGGRLSEPQDMGVWTWQSLCIE